MMGFGTSSSLIKILGDILKCSYCVTLKTKSRIVRFKIQQNYNRKTKSLVSMAERLWFERYVYSAVPVSIVYPKVILFDCNISPMKSFFPSQYSSVFNSLFLFFLKSSHVVYLKDPVLSLNN